MHLLVSILAAVGLASAAVPRSINSKHDCSGSFVPVSTSTLTSTVRFTTTQTVYVSSSKAVPSAETVTLTTTKIVHVSSAPVTTSEAAVSTITLYNVPSSGDSTSTSFVHVTSTIFVTAESTSAPLESTQHGSVKYTTVEPPYANGTSSNSVPLPASGTGPYSVQSTSNQMPTPMVTSYPSSSLLVPSTIPTVNGPATLISMSSSGVSSTLVAAASHSTFINSLVGTSFVSRGVSPTLHRPAWANTTSSSATLPTPTACGEHGNFTLGWDDEPVFSPSAEDPIRYPPVFNPYHHFFFSNGYAYVPTAEDPYQPISPSTVAIFLPNASTRDIGSPSAAGARPGELGAGPRAYWNVYWFNVFSAWFGCDNSGPNACRLVATGFSWDADSRREVQQVHEVFSVPACPGMKGCRLELVNFIGSWHGLSGLQVAATVQGRPVPFYMDSLSMGWFNDTCAAGLERIKRN